MMIFIIKIITLELGWQLNFETLNLVKESICVWVFLILIIPDKNDANCEVRTHAVLQPVDLKSTPLNHSGKLAALSSLRSLITLKPILVI